MPTPQPLRVLLLIASVIFIASAPASASVIELFNPSASTTVLNGGPGRGILFNTSQSFSITSIGIHGNLVDKAYDVLIYSGSTGGAGNIVASTTNTNAVVQSDGNGTNWNDLAINYTFASGQDYIVVWRPNDGVGDSWVVDDQLTTWRLSPTSSSDDYAVTGFTMTSGRSNTDGQDGNHYAPRMRFNAIPEPATLGMLAIGAGLLTLRRRTGK